MCKALPDGEGGCGKVCIVTTPDHLSFQGTISFTDAPPMAYAYLQEEDAETWEPGEEINEQQYNTLCYV